MGRQESVKNKRERERAQGIADRLDLGSGEAREEMDLGIGLDGEQPPRVVAIGDNRLGSVVGTRRVAVGIGTMGIDEFKRRTVG